ncbi:MAG: PEGA domain-containing protein [Polyangiaceae bacterium]
MLRGLRLVVTLVAALLLLTVASAASAQPAADAQKLTADGDKAAQANKWADALDLFQKAHAASPSQNTLKRVANALYKLDKKVEALDTYEQLLKDFSSKLTAAERKTAQDRVKELKDKVGVVTLRITESGASVTLDGAQLGTTPLSKPVRVLPGSHTLRVTKSGFEPLERTVDVAAKASVNVEIQLVPIPPAGTLSVVVKGADGVDMRIVIDGAEVGKAPYRAELSPGKYKVLARAATHRSAEVTVNVDAGQTTSIELEAKELESKLEIRVDPAESAVEVDGAPGVAGNFSGAVRAGEHTIRVTAEGYAPAELKIKVEPGETYAESVTLRRATAGQVVENIEAPWSFDGVYGGFELVGMFEPAGSGNTMSTSCEVTGATTCEGGLPLGGGLGFYVGYAFAPIGLELYILAAGDVQSPHASFDGETSSDINPLVAKPAREEEFLIGRFGGGGVARLRLLAPVDIFRFTAAIGAGVAYRHLLLKRDTVADNGAESSVGNEDGTGYLTAVLSVAVGGQVLLGGTTALTFGANLWLEHAGDGVATEARTDVYLSKEGEIPQPQATPAYDMVSGTQVFIGPAIGLHFGP